MGVLDVECVVCFVWLVVCVSIEFGGSVVLDGWSYGCVVCVDCDIRCIGCD